MARNGHFLAGPYLQSVCGGTLWWVKGLATGGPAMDCFLGYALVEVCALQVLTGELISRKNCTILAVFRWY